MSHQPSTLDNVKDTALSAYNTVTSSIDPSQQQERSGPKPGHKIVKDDQGTPCKKGDFKDQLNKAARGEPHTEQKEESYIQKGISALQQTMFGQGPEPKQENGVVDDGTPPTRPDHDVQVEEFLRKQYKSKNGAGVPQD